MQPILHNSPPQNIEKCDYSEIREELLEESSHKTVTSTSGNTDMITQQLDRFSSRKSSIGNYFGNGGQGRNSIEMSSTYFNKLTSAYHQAALAKQQRAAEAMMLNSQRGNNCGTTTTTTTTVNRISLDRTAKNNFNKSSTTPIKAADKSQEKSRSKTPVRVMPSAASNKPAAIV